MNKPVYAITILLWIGAAIFLIWFLAVELAKTSNDSYLAITAKVSDVLPYPGIFACPVAETLASTNTSGIGVATGLPAIVHSVAPFSNDNNAFLREYFVCPRTVTFSVQVGGATKSVKCFDFQQNPVYRGDVTNITCDQSATQSYYYQTQIGAVRPSAPWTATSEETNIVMPILQSFNISHEPIMVLFYSSKTAQQAPATFDQYRDIFTLSGIESAFIPLGTSVAIHIDKATRRCASQNLIKL